MTIFTSLSNFLRKFILNIKNFKKKNSNKNQTTCEKKNTDYKKSAVLKCLLRKNKLF